MATQSQHQNLLEQFDTFTQQCAASKLPAPLQPSAVLLAYDPLLSQGAFRMTGDPHAIAQAMLHALLDPNNPAFREVLAEVWGELVAQTKA